VWPVIGGAERAVGAAAGPVASADGRNATIGPITEGASTVVGAACRNADIVWPAASTARLWAGAVAEDAEPLGAAGNNVAKLSQTGHAFPLQGNIIGFTKLRIIS